jgi:biopolymer transport protein ExbB/biopolymer transport protein TolQ
MGLVARLIVIALGTMSLVSLGLTGERVLFFRKSRADSMQYANSVERLLAEGRLYEVAQLRAGSTGGYLGRVIEAGLRVFVRSHGAGREYVLESVGRALERQAQREIQTLKRGQSVVATISSTAPFVGLLGTVMGIVTAFQSMASTGSGGLGAVSGGISEALITTAIGLVVAIPAVFSFNYMQSWVDARAVDLSESSNELLDVVGRSLGAAPGAAASHHVAPTRVSHLQPVPHQAPPQPQYAQEHMPMIYSSVVPSSQHARAAAAAPLPMHRVPDLMPDSSAVETNRFDIRLGGAR